MRRRKSSTDALKTRSSTLQSHGHRGDGRVSDIGDVEGDYHVEPTRVVDDEDPGPARPPKNGSTKTRPKLDGLNTCRPLARMSSLDSAVARPATTRMPMPITVNNAEAGDLGPARVPARRAHHP